MNEIKESEEIQKAFIAVVILTTLFAIVSLVIGFKHVELGIEYETLQAEKEALEDLTEMQSSMISDLEENLRNLDIEIENLKFGGNE